MKLIRAAIRSSLSLQNGSTPRLSRPFSAQPLSSGIDYRQNFNSSDSADDSEQQSISFSSIYKDLKKTDSTKYRPGTGSPFGMGNQPGTGSPFGMGNQPGTGSPFDLGNDSGIMDGLDEVTDTSLNDGMEFKLKKAATYFEFDPEEVTQDNYTFRPDVNFQSGMTYDTKDLDLRKPGVHMPRKRFEFETNTMEVLRKADFRNVRFLANFLTEAGIIIKRSKTGISAKAQRKVAREIKTARAFGLMPFTTMGTKHFVAGNSMEDHEMDFGYEAYEHNFVDDDVE